MPIHRTAIALFLGGCLSFAAVAPAAAQPAKAEAEAVATELAKDMFEVMNINALILKGLSGSDMSDFAKIRPGWPRLFAEAASEEMTHDTPAFSRVTGRARAQYFSIEELRAGLIIFREPAFREAAAAGAQDKPAPKTPKSFSKAFIEVSETDEGKSFLAKLDGIGSVIESVQNDLLTELIPGTFRRFGEKAEAAEATRSPSR